MIFDTHCHGFWRGLAQREFELRDNMRKAGVVCSVHVGTDLMASQASLDLARNWGADTWCTAGFHPSGCQDLPCDSVQYYQNSWKSWYKATATKLWELAKPVWIISI